MFRKSKILLIVLALILSLSLVGCQSGENAAVTTTSQVEQNVESVSEIVNTYFSNIPSDQYKINQEKFIEKVKAKENMLVLDLRSSEDYKEGHVRGAINLPWGSKIAENIDKLPNDKPIYLYCHTGQTAGQTVALLNMAGLDAKSVNLGWNLGISKIRSIDDVIEKKANELSENSLNTEVKMKEEITNYYEGLAKVNDSLYKNYKISEENAKKLLDENSDDVIFVSIRSHEDYEKGHIKGAINISWGKGMEDSFEQLPKDKKIIVYCYTGQTAGQTVAGLRMLGYDAVALNGGMGMKSNAPFGWSNKGYEVTK